MDDVTPTRPGVSVPDSRTPATSSSRILAFGATHPGRVRGENEDAFVVAPEVGIAVVADGVASSGGGAIAAETVVTAVRDFLTREATRRLLAAARPDALGDVMPVLIAAAAEAHERVREAAQTSGYANMGSTLAMVLFIAGHVFVMHAGDSRAHRLREGLIEQITDDHTALNAWIEQYGPPSPEIVARLEHVIIRAVSARMNAVRPDIWVEPVKPGDVFLLSTDGLTKVVDEEGIHRIVSEAADIETAALRLIEAALAGGGPDNVTAVLIRHGSDRT